MSEKLFPCRDPAEIAAELFRSCQWEAGSVAGAAHKAAYYLFQELIERFGVEHARAQELVDVIARSDDAEKIAGARREMQLGVDRARLIFLRHGKPLEQEDRNEIKHHLLLGRLDIMTELTGEQNMLGLAKQIVEENKLLPRDEQKGAGGLDAYVLARLIQRLVRKRERDLAAGTWWGPVTHEQAVRHFGAQNVATFSNRK